MSTLFRRPALRLLSRTRSLHMTPPSTFSAPTTARRNIPSRFSELTAPSLATLDKVTLPSLATMASLDAAPHPSGALLLVPLLTPESAEYAAAYTSSFAPAMHEHDAATQALRPAIHSVAGVETSAVAEAADGGEVDFLKVLGLQGAVRGAEQEREEKEAVGALGRLWQGFGEVFGRSGRVVVA